MSEPLVEPRPPETLHPAVEPTPEIARKNALWAWGLTLSFVLLFGGTFLVGLTYLWLD